MQRSKPECARVSMKASVSVLILLCVANLAAAQGPQPAQRQHGNSQTTPPKPAETMPDMPGMQHDSAHQQPITFIDEILHHSTSGTSAQPNSTEEPMIMRARGSWML